MSRPVILWFRQDLRLADNRALAAACALGVPVIPIFVLDDNSPGRWKPGSASRWWLHASLATLADDLSARGGRLVLRRGATAALLADLVATTGAGAVHFSRCYEPWQRALETQVQQRLAGTGIDVRRFAGSLLREPEEVATKAGDPFRVYTPFWRSHTAEGIAPPRPRPGRLRRSRRSRSRATR